MLDELSKVRACNWWLDRGFELLPCQPGTKYLIAGYGEHRTHITRAGVQLFGCKNNWNVAVTGGIEKIILDFDDINLYASWAAEHEQIAKTYTEKTPRGGRHVFLHGPAPAGLILKPGVELKRLCVVAPSVVGGIAYTRGEGEILSAEPEEIFSSLSKQGTRTVYALKADRARRVHLHGSSLIVKIKEHWSVEKVFSLYRPSAQLSGRGRYKQTCCPFHEDHKPSFFLDTEKQLFGCHGCGVHGDVINLYARFEHIDNREAISRMSQSLGGRS